MARDKISSNEAIDAALHLDGDPEQVKQYYANWAKTYDRDVGDARYSGPEIAADMLQRLADSTSSVLDAGCGTGQVGIALAARGFEQLDGFDLSAEMADIALASGAYREVIGDVDMMRAVDFYPGKQYDAVLSVGVFTLGHVPPEALVPLIELTRPGGLLLVSTRSHYYEETDFQQQVDTLLEAGHIEQIQVIRDAPYNHDGDAHYWVFRKLK